MNKTRKIKNKTHVKKRIKSNEKRNEKRKEKDISIEKIIIDDNVGCVTVNNSFEENFEKYFKNKKGKLKKNAKYDTIGK